MNFEKENETKFPFFSKNWKINRQSTKISWQNILILTPIFQLKLFRSPHSQPQTFTCKLESKLETNCRVYKRTLIIITIIVKNNILLRPYETSLTKCQAVAKIEN